MNPWRWVDPRIETVTVASLKEYFLSRGWKQRSSGNANTLLFEEPSATGEVAFTQAVPASEDFSDYPRHVAELITTLSEIENRHPVEVLEDIVRHSMRPSLKTRAKPNGSAENTPPSSPGEIDRKKRRNRPA